MKKFLFVISLTAVLLTGCTNSQDNISSQTQATTKKEETTTEVSLINDIKEIQKTNSYNNLSISNKKISKEIKDDKGNVISSLKIDYPVIDGIENSEKINKYILSQTDRFTKISKEWTNGVENEVIAGQTFPLYTFEFTYETTYKKDGYLSFLYTQYSNFLGAAHPSADYISVNINLLTGEPLKFTDVFKGTEKDISDMISQTFTTLINEEPNNYYYEAKESLASPDLLKTAIFYLTDDGVTVLLPTYFIASYAAGPQKISIPYDSPYINTNFKKS